MKAETEWLENDGNQAMREHQDQMTLLEVKQLSLEDKLSKLKTSWEDMLSLISNMDQAIAEKDEEMRTVSFKTDKIWSSYSSEKKRADTLER